MGWLEVGCGEDKVKAVEVELEAGKEVVDGGRVGGEGVCVGGGRGGVGDEGFPDELDFAVVGGEDGDGELVSGLGVVEDSVERVSDVRGE